MNMKSIRKDEIEIGHKILFHLVEDGRNVFMIIEVEMITEDREIVGEAGIELMPCDNGFFVIIE